MKVKWFMMVCFLMAVLVVVGCVPTRAPKAPEAKVPAGYESIRMVGGSLGGVTSTAVLVLSATFNKYLPEIEWSSSSGSVGANVVYLTKGTLKLSMAGPPDYVAAYGYDKVSESRLRSVAHPTQALQNFFLIPEDKPWKNITEVPKGLTLVPGTPGSASSNLCEPFLKLAGLSKTDFNWVPLGKTELTDAWRAGKVDLTWVGFGGVAPYITDMQNSPRKIKAMGLSAEQAARAKAEKTFERVGASGIAETNIVEVNPEIFKYNVLSPQYSTLLLARDDFPEDIAYRIAKIIDEHSAELVQTFPAMKNATELLIKWAKPPFDIHPGVAKYYKEKGYLK